MPLEGIEPGMQDLKSDVIPLRQGRMEVVSAHGRYRQDMRKPKYFFGHSFPKDAKILVKDAKILVRRGLPAKCRSYEQVEI